MKGIVEASKVDRRWKDRLCGGNERQRLRDVQRREMCGGTKLAQNLRRDELVGAEFGPSVYHAMAYGHWSCVNMIPDCRCESGSRGRKVRVDVRSQASAGKDRRR